MAASTRTVVVGLGVVGLSTALALARRGTHVIGVDRLGSGHPYTSSTGVSRSIRVAYALPDYARLAAEALDRWAQLEVRTGGRLLHLTGQVDIGTPDILAGLTVGLRAAGAEYDEMTATDMRRRIPQIAVGDDACGLFHPRAGAVLADRAMAALRAEAVAAGAELRSPERAASVSPSAAGVRVTTEAGTIAADRAVIAAGPWTPELAEPLGAHLPLAPAYGQVTYFDAPGFVGVPGFVEWGHPGGCGVYGHPVPGVGYKLGFDAAGDDPWRPDSAPVPDPEEQRRLEEWVAGRMPGLSGRALRSDRHPWTMTPDGDFAIGAIGPVTIAAGCSGPPSKRGRLTALLLTFFLTTVAACLATVAFAQQDQAPKQAPISPSTQPVAPNAPGQQANDSQGEYKIKSQVSLVVLHASVLNDRSVFVPGLEESNFRVFEDKVEQKLSVFKQEDVPVSFGIVVDNSGSMRDKRPQVNAAALTFVKTSNPQDEGFVVNFNDDYYLDTEHDFTNDIEEMKTALERIDARGSTALYDAVIGSLDHLKKGKRDKKVILVVTDGEDNASRHSLENTVEQAQRNDAVIYAVGVFSDDDIKHNHRAMKKASTALSRLAIATGGLAFFPEDANDTEAICTQIAHDIRNQYTMAYYPSNTAHDGSFRSVQVEVVPPRGAGKLTVRTRAGYYAPRAPASGN